VWLGIDVNPMELYHRNCSSVYSTGSASTQQSFQRLNRGVYHAHTELVCGDRSNLIFGAIMF
jgi:hypothetical protein